MEKWNFKTVVVTGANSGIGYATMRKLAQAGMRAVGFDIQTENIERLSKEYQDKIFFQQVDVCDYEALRKAFKFVEEKCGGVDVLINNAGIVRRGKILEEGDENMEGILKTIDTNFAGSVRCCRLAYNSMKRKDFGYIININSVDGHYVPREFTFNSYSGSKHAITAMSEVLRQELMNLTNNRIKITSISPGAVETKFLRYTSDYIQRKMYDNLRLFPEDIADAIHYLLSTPNSVNVTEFTIRSTAHAF